MLWSFGHKWDLVENERAMLQTYNDKNLLKLYDNKHLWKGCFGGMSIIKHDYLKEMNNRYEISKLLDYVVSREQRSSFERAIACLLQGCLLQIDPVNESLLGDIHEYCKWGIEFDEKEKYSHLPMIKVWTGR